MRFLPVLFLLWHYVSVNALVYYALSEEGREAGREQFGDQHPLKLKQFTYTVRESFTTAFAVVITLVSPSWFWYSVFCSTGYICAQNLLQY